jgi:hypothetical protein
VFEPAHTSRGNRGRPASNRQARAATADQILAGRSLDVPPPAALRAAVHG